MIDTKFYKLKSKDKRMFFNNVLSNYHGQREDIVCLNPGQPETDEDKYLKRYHVMATTVCINNYPEPKTKNNIVTTITAWGKTREDFKKRVRDAKTLLEKLGEEELIERDILLGE